MKETVSSAKAKTNKSPITVFVTDETREKLSRIAKSEELKLSDIVRRALKEYTEKENR